MHIKRAIFLLHTFLIVSATFGQNAIEFIENRGQWDKQVRFMGQVPGGAFFVHTSGFTVLQHQPEEWKEVQERIHGSDKAHKKNVTPFKLHSHAYKVEFLNAAKNPEIIADKPIPTYNNYFIGNDPSKWAVNCKIYQGITVKDIYPGIDLRYYSNAGLMKYDLIVKPGADLSKIALKYDGVDELAVKKEELHIKTSIGSIKELYPYSYQYNKKGKREVPASYQIKGTTVRFNIKNYDKAETLVIDPTMIFASFTGSTADNWGFTATYGPDGSMYGGGIVFGSGFPASPGAFDQTYEASGAYCGQKGIDIGIIKLSPDGTTRIYATYIGGDNSEQPHSLVVDGAGNLILAGRTNSSTNSVTGYPTTGVGMFGPGGGNDIIVTKLNAAGNAIIGSKRVGGSGEDGVNITACDDGRNSLQYNYGDQGRSEVIIDGGGNIYVASSTQSASSDAAKRFPTLGGFQTTFGGGLQDGVVLKFDASVSSLLFSSFLGGGGDDAAYVLSINPSTSDIYVAGGTASSNFPGVSGGVKYPSPQGGIDGFVSIISNNGSTLQRSTYMGTSGTDQVYGVQFDRFNFPYIMGQTTGNWPVQNASFSQNGGKQFIVKLLPDLSDFVYSTKFGTNSATPNISPTAFLVDRCENVYVSGWGGTIGSYTSAGTIGLSTVNPLRPTTDGEDFYFFVLKRNATAQLYGDFYGQTNGAFADHVDGGTSRFDANGVIYQAICASCSSTGPFPTTPGAWAQTKPTSANCNLAMVKIALNLAGTAASVQSVINGVVRDSSGCVPLTVDFRDTILSAVTYEWDFNGDGISDDTTTAPTNSYTYTAIGSYLVRLIAVDSSSCNIRDTSFINIRVGDLQALPSFTIEKQEPCEKLQYKFSNTSVPPAIRSFNDSSFVWDFGDGTRVRAGTAPVLHSYAAPGAYSVKLILVDTAYCNAPDSVTQKLNVATLVKARIKPVDTACTPAVITFENESDGGQQFFWDFGDGSPVVTDPEPTHTFINNGTAPVNFRVRLRVVDSATCNRVDSTSIVFTVYPQPTAAFSIGSPQPPPVNTPVTFINNSSADAIRFKWLWGDGDSLLTNSREPVTYEFNSTKTYQTCLVVFNSNGCTDTVCAPVQAIVEPALDVPNAFTPLSGDQNSIVYARGFAIGKMKFIIWNRWGQKVFETENRKQGWDGRYKGVIQPMDVYAYTLEVEFTDGTKASKKGDITLIR